MKRYSKFSVLDLTKVAFNYIPRVDVEALTVKRKGKVIKGETEAKVSAAQAERRLIVNAAKRERRARRAA